MRERILLEEGMMERDEGFSLIELMAVVAIVAILAAIAYPQYGDYVIRSRIPEATSALASKRVQMEQYFQDNRTYMAAPACSADANTSRVFTFSCVAGSVNSTEYVLQAVGNAGGPMAGFSYSINQANVKVSNITRAGWANPAPNNCWATKKDGSC